MIDDSEIHDLDVTAVTGSIDDNGPTLACGRPLVIRAGANQRPIIRLAQPLRFVRRPAAIAGDTPVQLEGLS